MVVSESMGIDALGGSAKTPKGERRRAEIMAAATELFLERGFRATSLDDIGAVVGVSGPAIYRYFKSKHVLLSVLIEEAAIKWRGRCRWPGVRARRWGRLGRAERCGR